MRGRSVLLFIAAFCAATSVSAQMYMWTDAQGRKHYTDTPPPPTAKGVQKKRIDTTPAVGSTEPYALRSARERFPVKLYTGPECGAPCADARGHLNRRGTPFTEISVSNAARLDELQKVSGGTDIPVLLVGSETHKGYAALLYDRALDEAGYPKAGVLPARAETTRGEADRKEKPAAPDQGEEAPAPRGPYAPRPAAEDAPAR